MPLIKRKTTSRLKKLHEPADPVTYAEYLRRKNKLEKEKNPNAPTIHRLALMKAVERGYIPIYIYGNNKFIDWEESKGYVFKTYSIHTTKAKQKIVGSRRK